MMAANTPRSAVVAFCMLLACWSRAFAVNPTLDVSQYAHTARNLSDRFTKGAIFVIAHTPDGEDLPDQTLISSLLHKYAAGRLKEREATASPTD